MHHSPVGDSALLEPTLVHDGEARENALVLLNPSQMAQVVEVRARQVLIVVRPVDSQRNRQVRCEDFARIASELGRGGVAAAA